MDVFVCPWECWSDSMMVGAAGKLVTGEGECGRKRSRVGAGVAKKGAVDRRGFW